MGESTMPPRREYVITDFMDYEFQTINDKVSMAIKTNPSKVPFESYLQSMKDSINNYFLLSRSDDTASSGNFKVKPSEERKVIVAVVGMLHCNGISRRLIGEGFIPLSGKDGSKESET